MFGNLINLKDRLKFLGGGNDIVFLGAVYPLRILRTRKGLHCMTAMELCIRNLPQTSSVIFKKDVGMELGLFDEKRHYGEDIQFYQKFLLLNSYYVLAEQLTEVDVGKKYFGEFGLTSNLRMMSKGRDKNTLELYEMGLISFPFLIIMICLNQIKYYRRCVIKVIEKLRYEYKTELYETEIENDIIN